MALAAELERTHPVDFPVLGGIPEDDRRRVMCNARRRRFKRDDTIFYEGDPGDTLHLLRTGHVAVKLTTPLGDVATLAVLGPGDCFGELSVLAATASRSASVVCLEHSETLSIHRGELDELRRRHPSVSDVLLQVVTARLPSTSSRLLEALYVRADKRVLRRLLTLAESFGEVIPLTQDDVAELAGATRPTVNRVLKEVEAAGLIRLRRGQIELLDLEAIARRAR